MSPLPLITIRKWVNDGHGSIDSFDKTFPLAQNPIDNYFILCLRRSIFTESMALTYAAKKSSTYKSNSINNKLYWK